MFLEIPDLLTTAEVAELRHIGDVAPFVDGRISNPHNQTKANLRLNDRDAFQRSAQMMMTALGRCAAFDNWAFPKTLAVPTLTKYALGGKYGVHADAGFMPMGPDKPALRSDLSCTIFISAPETYDGGELVIHLGTRTVAIKGAAGSAVIYPSTTLHEVMPVTRGDRLVGLTFIESRLRDPAQRDLLHELNEVAALEGLNMHWDNFTRLQRVQNGLMRMWGDG